MIKGGCGWDPVIKGGCDQEINGGCDPVTVFIHLISSTGTSTRWLSLTAFTRIVLIVSVFTDIFSVCDAG